MDASLNLKGRHPFCFRLDSAVIVIVNILGNRLGEGLKGGIILFKSIHIWISPVRCPRRMQSSISSQKTPKYKKLSRKRKTAQNPTILSCFMMKCRWWDSNPHGFPSDFESLASAIPPHRLMFRTLLIIPDSLPKIKTKNQRGNLPPAACFFCAGRWTEPTPGGILGADVLHHRRV